MFFLLLTIYYSPEIKFSSTADHSIYFCSAVLVSISSVAGLALRKVGNCSQGADKSNLRNSWANSSGSHTTRFFSSSYRSCKSNEYAIICNKKHLKENSLQHNRKEGNHDVVDVLQIHSQLRCVSNRDDLQRKLRTCPKFHVHTSLLP